jgi:acetyl-CoA synthetase
MTNIPVFNAPAEYYELWKLSIENPEGFWAKMAEASMDDIYWFKKWDKVFERGYPHFKWFAGGMTNVGYNCIDYKQSRYSDKVAYIHEAPEMGLSRTVTYGQLFDITRKYSAALRKLGIQKGDRVLLYLPNSIEAATLLLACARIGAISICVFAGFSPGALADRIELTRPKAIFTQDSMLRRGKEIELKKAVDKALGLCPQEIAEEVRFVITNGVMSEQEITAVSDRDISFAEFEARGEEGDQGYIQLEANEPLLIMCTSGTTAKPKPVVHVHGGFQIWSYWTAKWIYDLKPEDVIFNTSDIGWIVGQCYLVFAPLLTGCTAILYEGTPDYPKPDIWWETIEKHKATIIWTAPTGARVLRALGVEQAERHDLSSVEMVVCAGEVLNPEVWSWLREDLFKGKVPVTDHMWQTEIPGAMFGYPCGVRSPKIKLGSAGFPIPGVLPEIVDEHEGKPCQANEKGILLLKEPTPGMTQTLWGDPDRYREEYWEAQPITKGKYFTGDSAYIDEDGYIWFCGRSDEVIKIAAHRIGPAEVESALISHPAVSEAGVCGIPDELRGEVAAAFIVLKPGLQPSEKLKKGIIQQVRKVMGPIVVFKGVEFVNVLPKTRSGKIMRRVMRKLWLGEELGDLSTIETQASVEEVKEAISKLHRQT